MQGKTKNLTDYMTILAIGLWLLIIASTCSFAQTCNTWFDPGWITDEAIYSAPNSMSGLLDAPAGKYGRPTISGGDFILNGATKRFWGTNWDFTYIVDNFAVMPSRVRAWTFQGYNMLRSHGIDNNQWGYGIFEPTRTTTRALDDTPYDGSRLQMFDYAFSMQKAAGMYTQLTLYSGRTFLAADGITDFASFVASIKDAANSSAGYGWLSKAGQLMIFWNTEIQGLFYEYASSLLNHVNPYTGVAYKNDPALAIVQMLNEPWVEGYFWGRDCMNDATYEGLTHDGYTWVRNSTVCTSALPASWYAPMLQSWNDWVEEKYVTVAAAKTAWGLPGPGDFQPEVDDYAVTDFTFHIPNRYFCANGRYQGGWNGTHCNDVLLWMRQAQDDFYNEAISYFQNTIGWTGPIITEGGYYPMSTGPRTGDVGEAHAYLNHPSTVGIRQTTPLGSSLVMTDNHEIEPSAMTLCSEPTAYVFVNGSCDAVGTPLTFLNDKPQMIGETLVPYPSTYAYEAPLRTAVRTLNAGYDAYMHFKNDGLQTNAGHGEGVYCTSPYCQWIFGFNFNLQQTALGQLGAWLFETHSPGEIAVSPESAGVNATGVEEHIATDYWAVMGAIGGNSYSNAGITITAVNDGVVALFSKAHKELALADDLMALVVGPIKQEGARWIDSTHYDWGTDGSPQMYPVGVTIKMPDARPVKIFAVDADGTETEVLPITYLEDGKTAFDICSQGNAVWYKIQRKTTTIGRANIKKGILR